MFLPLPSRLAAMKPPLRGTASGLREAFEAIPEIVRGEEDVGVALPGLLEEPKRIEIEQILASGLVYDIVCTAVRVHAVRFAAAAKGMTQQRDLPMIEHRAQPR